MFRLFECCALSFFERFVLSFSLKIERFVSDSAEIWICGLYINENLEQQAQALFDFYFIKHPETLGNCKSGNLIDIANYTNGLAMQRFRPWDSEKGIPVLKIKELGQGKIDSSSDVC